MRKGDVFGFVLLALGLGVAAGILIAPKSGKETRKELSEKLEKGIEEISDFMTYESGRIKTKVAETIENIKSKCEEKVNCCHNSHDKI
ncbi:MAG: YtxH domain-containing protein [Actinomycetota bacterium]|nr:YtxH domain-containing protein [Actinomycetota bacterium]